MKLADVKRWPTDQLLWHWKPLGNPFAFHLAEGGPEE